MKEARRRVRVERRNGDEVTKVSNLQPWREARRLGRGCGWYDGLHGAPGGSS